MPRVGAEYGHGEVVRWTGRIAFLGQVENVVPAVLETLQSEVLPPYRTAWYDPGPFPPRKHWELQPSFFRRDIAALATDHPDLGYDRLAPLAAALRSWSDCYHLRDEWCIQVALSTLYEWTGQPALAKQEPLRFVIPSYGGPVHEGPERPDFELPEWHPTIETWPAYKARAQAMFNVALRRYRDAAAPWAEELGLELAPSKRSPRKLNDLLAHFTWLALFQCDGWTQERIAQRYGRKVKSGSGHTVASTVPDALRATAKLIGLTRRSL